ncbi:MAG TPA: T9SS type A sorting domain-containing protein [Candidatus Kapabacteria bacterium]|nr:T9SS type A sorting domain-containing protein [Candidatus Kapabacteria bacterium]
MKKIVTAFALCALTLLLDRSAVHAQQQKPSAEYASIWDATLNRWKDTVLTYTMTYTPEYTLSSRGGKYLTTYTGFTPVTSEVYQSRFFWEPRMTYSQVRIDSVHENGALTPIRLDQYDRTTPRKTVYTRSTWTGTEWKTLVQSISETDTLGLLRSSVNHSTIGGEFKLVDSTHVDVVQDIKGNVLSIKISQWTIQEPMLQVIAEQRYTLAGDGSIGVAEIWNNANGDLAPAFRLHSIDWVARNKSFSYVQREPSSQLFVGGDAYRSAIVDLASGGEWSEYYQIQQTFDDQNRLTSYLYSGISRDTFMFDEGLISLNQHDDLVGGQWSTERGTKTIYDRDANGTLRSVITQKFDPNTSKYINDRLYFYVYGTANVTDAIERTSLSVYPNPATQSITINSSEPVIAATIISTTGAELLKSSTDRIDVSSLSPGSYGVRVITASGEHMLKFIKVH